MFKAVFYLLLCLFFSLCLILSMRSCGANDKTSTSNRRAPALAPIIVETKIQKERLRMLCQQAEKSEQEFSELEFLVNRLKASC